MSIKNGVWYNSEFDKPTPGERVLCVKMPKNGNRDYCLGAWYDPTYTYPEGHWVTNGSCTNVTHWMPLPKLPE